MAEIELMAPTPMGLEAVAGREIKELGYEDAQIENGRVLFRGDELAICRANLWLRTAERVLIKMGEFTAVTFDELFTRVRALPWEEWIPADGAFVVEGKSHQSQLSSVPACQRITEKAVVERLKQRYALEWFPKTGARYTITVALLKNVVTLTLDTTGPGLHKRGYRQRAGEAPIKETLAAAMILLSRWHHERPFLDPLCGAGTLPIEAALIGHRRAPGLHRAFAAEQWGRVGSALWQQARDEAFDLEIHNRTMQITASDHDPAAIALGRQYAQRLGLSRSITFRQAPLATVRAQGRYGYLITNPPYGERLMGEAAEMEELYRNLGKMIRALDDWSAFVITPHAEFERLTGLRPDKRRKLYNGRIACTLYQMHGPYHARPIPHETASSQT